MRLVTAGLLAAALGLAACAESATSSAPDFSSSEATSEPAGTSQPGEATDLPTEVVPTETAPAAPACSPQSAEVGDVPEPVTFEGEPPTELVVEVLAEAQDPEAVPQVGDCVQVHYIGRLFDTGEVFDSSYPRGSTLPVVVGEGGVIPGFEQGVAQTPLGATTRVTIQPELGYGASGTGPIPPNATLVFDIEVVSIS